MGNRGRGFTLLELLITLALAGILLGLAVPATQVLTANNRTVAVTNSVLGVLHNARAESIRYNRAVWISPAATGEAGIYRWQSGIAMSVEDDSDTEDDILRRIESIDERLVVSVSGVAEENRAFGFNPGGFLLNKDDRPVFTFCNSVWPGNSREIRINAGGQITMTSP
ncbi:MAG: prepilin-type N-terminal cleavage/methylation domain-containing protein, partial [Halomonadaceae bacterium]